MLLSLVLLIVTRVWAAASPVSPVGSYLIVPNDTTHCNPGTSVKETCFTLQQFMDNINTSYSENVTLNFLPGRHLFIGGVVFLNVSNVLLKGKLNDTDSVKPVISCRGLTCFSFYNTSTIQIENLTFSESSSENFQIDGGAIFVSEAEAVSITKCLFFDNFVLRSRGGALRMSCVQNVHILQTHFINNSALCYPSWWICPIGCSASGGAISIQLVTSFIITDSLFEGNVASCHGGAVYSFNSTIEITNCQFINNGIINYCNKDFKVGGGLETEVSGVQISDSLFQGNKANFGGGIFLSGGISFPSSTVLVRIVNTSFTLNTACLSGGGAYLSNIALLIIDNTTFANNTAYISGGGISVESEKYTDHHVSISDSSFYTNKARKSGGAADFYNINFSIENSFFHSNTAYDLAGAIYVLQSIPYLNGSISKCTFHRNAKTGKFGNRGGAITLLLSNRLACTVSCEVIPTPTGNESLVSIDNCVFELNIMIGKGGGAIFAFQGVIQVTNSMFSGNIAEGSGGAVANNANIAIFRGNNFTNNTAIKDGGAIDMILGIMYSQNNVFLDNRTPVGGGAVSAVTSTVVSQYDQYIANQAHFGGARFVTHSDVIDTECVYIHNNASLTAGAVAFADGTFKSTNSSYIENYARISGAVLMTSGAVLSINGDEYISNIAEVIQRPRSPDFDNGEIITINNISLTFSKDIELGNYNTIHLSDTRGQCRNIIFNDNIGSMFLFYSTIQFSGAVIFRDNFAVIGGALQLVHSTLTFEKLSQAHITGNSASKYGGGIFLNQGELNVYSSLFRIENNTATVSGGAIYAYQSQISIESVVSSKESVFFNGNSADQDGGALFAIASSLNIFSRFVVFARNEGWRGGALALFEGSRLYIIRKTLEFPDSETSVKVKVTFSHNTAGYGGAIFVSDNSNTGVLCKQSLFVKDQIRSLSSTECFIQTLSILIINNSAHSMDINYMNVFFQSNVANKSGNDIFGGLLDRCKVDIFSELSKTGFIGAQNGFDYLKLIAKFEIDFDYNKTRLSHPLNPESITKNITSEKVKDLISSEPVRLCFCENSTHNCSHQWPTVFAKKGEEFPIRAVTVDQVENPVNGTILASVISDGTRLKVDQSRQVTNGVCTELVYTIFSTKANATFQLFPDGPCDDMGISSRAVSITFLPCDCPNGLQPASLENECRCVCDSSIESYLKSCQVDNGSIVVVRETEIFWVQYVNDDNVGGFLLQTCPYDYCVDYPVNLSMSLPLNVDKQCANNRSGIMCGECEEGLSLVFGSSRCVQCNNNYLALLIAFALAGIALVAFILILNMTVAVGTIHGLILYANIVGANSPVFLPPGTALSFFVSWVNLDLGFESCFYDGMDSSTKVWLQLVFPAYIISLSALIIVVSNYWGWFAGLIGRKNPVGTLCTLFLLSYSKLLRTTIGLLQFTHLSYPDGSRKLFWLYNPNIPYFTPSRIPCFIVAAIIIALGTVYTLLLFFGQWLRKIRQRRIARLFQNGKYNAFMDAYHAPFTFKHRYWVGILLFTRILHHFLSATLSQTSHLLIICCLMTSLMILKMLAGNVYKNWLIGILETTHFINLLLFSVSTYYLTVSSSTGAQAALANVSVIITFITFLGVALYHTHTHFLRDLRVYPKLSSAVKNHLRPLVSKLNILRGHSRENFHGEIGNEMRPPSSFREPLLREPVLEDTAPLPAQQILNKSSDAVSTPGNPQPVTRTIVCIKNTDSEDNEG